MAIVIGFCVIARVIPPVYETNDNRIMMNIISGQYGSKYSSYSVFMGYPLSFLLSKLYILKSNIPWYGIFFCGVIIYSAWTVLREVAYKIKVSEKRVGYVGIFIILLILYINIFVCQQFTVIATVLAMTAVYKILKRESWIQITILCFLSYQVRYMAFFMAVPFIILAILWNGLEEKQSARVILKSKVLNLGIIVIVIIFGMVVNKVAYSSEEWKSYDRYNEERALLYDYNAYWNSDAYKEKCLKAGVSDSEYYITNSYNLLLDNDVSEGTIDRINQIVSNKAQEKPLLRIVKTCYYFIKNVLIWYIRYTLLMLFLDIIIFAILQSEKKKQNSFMDIICNRKIFNVILFCLDCKATE